MRSLSAALTAKKKKIIPAEADDKTVFFLFRQVVAARYGERGKVMIEPLFLRDGILGVKTKSPLWANELWLERSGLCKGVNAALGEEIVTDLKLLH